MIRPRTRSPARPPRADALALATAMARAQQKFGALDCKGTITAVEESAAARSRRARPARLAGAGARRARGRTLCSCADRIGDIDLALRAASRLRVARWLAGRVRGSAREVSRGRRELGDRRDRGRCRRRDSGATLWLDFVSDRQGAAAPRARARRSRDRGGGSARGAAISAAGRSRSSRSCSSRCRIRRRRSRRSQSTVASWKGALPSPEALADVLDKVHARAALIRHGDVVEVWGHAGKNEPLRRLGGEDGTRSVADADRAARADRGSRRGLERARAGSGSAAARRGSPRPRHRRSTRSAVAPRRGGCTRRSARPCSPARSRCTLHEQDTNTQEIRLHYP